MNERDSPFGGRDFPRTDEEFADWFQDEAACRAYLEKLRWPQGITCPMCGHETGWARSRDLWQCANCGHETSVTAGTAFDRTRIPLSTWFVAAWHMTNQSRGLSARELMRLVDLGSYQTAWCMLHKLRRSMVHPSRDRLEGVIEVDQACIGPVRSGPSGAERALIGIAAEIDEPKRILRVRLARIEARPAAGLVDFVARSVVKGSTIHTGRAELDGELAARGFVPRAAEAPRGSDRARATMTSGRRIASRLDRWLRTTYQGAVSAKHLTDYLDEFTFRFNERAGRRRGLLFYRLLQRAVDSDPVHYGDLVADP